MKKRRRRLFSSLLRSANKAELMRFTAIRIGDNDTKEQQWQRCVRPPPPDPPPGPSFSIGFYITEPLPPPPSPPSPPFSMKPSTSLCYVPGLEKGELGREGARQRGRG